MSGNRFLELVLHCVVLRQTRVCPRRTVSLVVEATGRNIVIRPASSRPTHWYGAISCEPRNVLLCLSRKRSIFSKSLHYMKSPDIYIYTTKIGTFVCPPHISETVAVRLLKLAHRSRIASTTKEIISKQLLLSIL